MIVVIANKLKSLIDASGVSTLEHQTAVGTFYSKDCIRRLSTMEFDSLILDITALKDAYEIETWNSFRELFPPEKTVLVFDQAKSYSGASFLSSLVTLGYYNFAREKEEIVRLLKNPNTYENVAKYQQMAMAMETKKETAEERYGEYAQGILDRQEEMQGYLKQSREEKPEDKKQPSALPKQLKVGLLLFPLLTFISTYLFYLLEVLLSHFVSDASPLGNKIYFDFYGMGLSPLTLLGLFLSYLLFAIFFVHLNGEIKRAQMTRGKFMIIPVAIFIGLVFGEYYFFGFLPKIYSFLMIFPISDKPYLYSDLAAFSRMVAIVTILAYYFQVWVYNSKTVRFEKDLSQNFTWIEKIWVVLISLILGLPPLYGLLKWRLADVSFFSSIQKVYENPLFFLILVGVEILLTAVIIFQTVFKKEKHYQVLKEEDL